MRSIVFIDKRSKWKLNVVLPTISTLFYFPSFRSFVGCQMVYSLNIMHSRLVHLRKLDSKNFAWVVPCCSPFSQQKWWIAHIVCRLSVCMCMCAALISTFCISYMNEYDTRCSVVQCVCCRERNFMFHEICIRCKEGVISYEDQKETWKEWNLFQYVYEKVCMAQGTHCRRSRISHDGRAVII